MFVYGKIVKLKNIIKFNCIRSNKIHVMNNTKFKNFFNCEVKEVVCHNKEINNLGVKRKKMKKRKKRKKRKIRKQFYHFIKKKGKRIRKMKRII